MPHSELVKVLVPKWKKSAMFASCHESWDDDGSGRIGRGGGLGVDVLVRKKWRVNEVSKKRVIIRRGSVDGSDLLFIFFLLMAADAEQP